MLHYLSGTKAWDKRDTDSGVVTTKCTKKEERRLSTECTKVRFGFVKLGMQNREKRRLWGIIKLINLPQNTNHNIN